MCRKSTLAMLLAGFIMLAALTTYAEPAEPLISNLVVSSGRTYEFTTCSLGETYYTDRDYTITQYSHLSYDGRFCIKTANEDKNNDDEEFITFTLNQAASIDIYTDQRVTDEAGWMDGLYERRNSKQIFTSDPDMGHFVAYRCKSTPGEIVLGGPKFNGGEGTNSMYVVSFLPEDEGDQLCSSVIPPPPPPPTPEPLLDIVMLSFDTPNTHVANLGPLYYDIIEGLRLATEDDAYKTAVVLTDFGEPDDTRIWIVRDGKVLPIRGLPALEGALTLDSGLTEYNMADGVTIGRFMRWARDKYPADRTIVSYAGHGTALTPDGDLNILYDPNRRTELPLPSWVDVDPAMTDSTSDDMISADDLRVALDIATIGGTDPIQLLDIAHCFAATIEQLYTVTKDAAVEAVVSSASYTYLSPLLFGYALEAIGPVDDAATMAGTWVASYETILAEADILDGNGASEHPRTLVALHGDGLQAVKEGFDTLSAELMTAFDNDPTGTRDLLLAAYQNSDVFYDTTFCPPHDWHIRPPDAIVDVTDFLSQFNSPTATQLISVTQAAVISATTRSGSPWFAEQAVNWQFENSSAVGLGLYADLQGVADGSTRTLSWQSHYYTETADFPFDFVLNSVSGHSWADVLTRYWGVRVADEGLTVQAEGCLPRLAPAKQVGEIAVSGIIFPDPNRADVGHPVWPTVDIAAATDIRNALILFEIADANGVVYSDTVGIAHIPAGTSYYLRALDSWLPQQAGSYTLTVTADADNRFDEANENDNVRQSVVTVSAGETVEFSAEIVDNLQLLTSPAALLHFSSTLPIETATLDLWQYENAALTVHDAVQVDSVRDNITDTAQLIELGANIEPGLLTLHVWPTANGKVAYQPEIIHLNYAPPSALLDEGEHFFWYRHDGSDDALRFELAVETGSADLAVWTPFNEWSADTTSGSGAVTYPNAQPGEYFVRVRGHALGTRYTLTIDNDASRIAAQQGDESSIQARRSDYVQPIPQRPSVPTAVDLLSHANFIRSTAEIVLATAVVIVVTLCVSLRRRRRA